MACSDPDVGRPGLYALKRTGDGSVGLAIS